jgi:hypothetical protein
VTPRSILLYLIHLIYPLGIQDLNILNTYTISMGFLDKLKRGLAGGKEKADDTKDAAQKTVEDSAEKAKRAAEDSAEKAKRAADKVDNAVDDSASASDELKKD